MRQRIDGIETRKRILTAACEVFAEKGFRDATVAGICLRAQANTAAVNYHFQDKESLYVAVWKRAAEEAAELYPIGGGVPADAAPEERFRGHIRALLKRVTDRGRLGYFHRLRAMEMARPTGLIDDIHRETLKPLREFSLALLRDLLGSQATPREVEFCEMSVIGPCLMAGFCTGNRLVGGVPAMSPDQVDALVDHLVVFSLAGLRAVRERNGPGQRRNTAR